MKVIKDIYEKYGKRLYGFILTLTGDEHLAEEILQETFYQVLIYIDRFEGRCSIYTWMCQIAKNIWYKECNRKRRFIDIEKTDMENWQQKTLLEEEMIKKDQCRQIRKAVNKLDEPYRDVFILHVLGEIKLKEIADMYGKTASWAKVTYFRAKAKIAELMK